MTVHKLSAGNGYPYLTRQVASADTGRAGQGLADYYTSTGCPPGRWTCGGAADHLTAAGASAIEVERAVRLGSRFPDYARLPAVQDRVSARAAALSAELGRDLTAAELKTLRS